MRMVSSKQESEMRFPPVWRVAPPEMASLTHSSTRSVSFGRMRGPMSVSSKVGSAVVIFAASAASLSASWGMMEAWAKMRWTETQTWPAW